MSTIQKHWRKHAKALAYGGKSGHLVIPEVICADGYTMSVQASTSHYCQPRWKMLKTGRYTMWEVQVQQRPFPKELRGMRTDDREPLATGSICGFVPTTVVDAIIARHGGLKEIGK